MRTPQLTADNHRALWIEWSVHDRRRRDKGLVVWQPLLAPGYVSDNCRRPEYQCRKHCQVNHVLKESPRSSIQSGSLVSHSDLALERDGLLIVWVDRNSAEGILPCLAFVATFKENPPQQNMRVDQLGIPEYRCF